MRHRSNQERKLARQKTRTTNVIAALYAPRPSQAKQGCPGSWIEQAVEEFHRAKKESAQTGGAAFLSEQEGQSRSGTNQKHHLYCIVREEVCQDGEV